MASNSNCSINLRCASSLVGPTVNKRLTNDNRWSGPFHSIGFVWDPTGILWAGFLRMIGIFWDLISFLVCSMKISFILTILVPLFVTIELSDGVVCYQQQLLPLPLLLLPSSSIYSFLVVEDEPSHPFISFYFNRLFARQSISSYLSI